MKQSTIKDIGVDYEEDTSQWDDQSQKHEWSKADKIIWLLNINNKNQQTLIDLQVGISERLEEIIG